ncbi:MAG: apolipoprotein N-acyltransferase [Planctomycetaceae bacterium]|nr:apolipoprotein N-acyltransferase [Planctomycetaceae bacterium]
MQKSKKVTFVSYYNGVFGLTLTGVALYLLALPPTSVWWLGWLVAACWTPILRRETLPSRAYRKIWLAGVIFWAVAVHWVCYAHWATCFGWVAMCCYLGIYFPLFFLFARIVHLTPIFGNIRIPLWFAAPVAWLAAMYLQKTLMGGFGFALLEHTLVRQTSLIQLADIGGESLVGAVMIFVGVLFGYCLPMNLSTNTDKTTTRDNKPDSSARKRLLQQTTASITAVALTFLMLISYAKFRESQLLPPPKTPLAVALLQGNFKASLSAPPEWYDKVFENYTRMAFESARNQEHDIDVIIWPESTCNYPWYDIDHSELSAGTARALAERNIKQIFPDENNDIIELTQSIAKPCIYGTTSYVFSEKNDHYYQYNSALLIEIEKETNYNFNNNSDQNAQKRFSRYDKMLLVMFGEYIPFAARLPENFFLKTLCQKANFGKKPVCFVLQNKKDHDGGRANRSDKDFYLASANICFESSSSSLIRQQLLTLKAQGEEPDFLINLSNDGWFRHSPQIDLHLATHLFRAIENRKPYLAATNGGFSVGIDGSGRILAIGQREKNQVVYVDVTADNRCSTYHFMGDSFHFTSLGVVFVMCIYYFLLLKKNSLFFPK